LLRSRRWVRLLNFWVLETCSGGLNSGVRWKKVYFWSGVAGDDGGAAADRHLRRRGFQRENRVRERIWERERTTKIMKILKGLVFIPSRFCWLFSLSGLVYLLLMLLYIMRASVAQLAREWILREEGDVVRVPLVTFPPFFFPFFAVLVGSWALSPDLLTAPPCCLHSYCFLFYFIFCSIYLFVI
jgi:hypothetical protein